MNPIATEVLTFDGRKVTLGWFAGSPDPGINISQVSAYCFHKGKLILVRNKRGWNIPGGHPEAGESILDTLARELEEEAGILPGSYDAKLIGWMRVEDPENKGVEGKLSAQLRFLVIVRDLPPFVPDDEIFERTLIDLADFEKYISWGSSPTGKGQLQTVRVNL